MSRTGVILAQGRVLRGIESAERLAGLASRPAVPSGHSIVPGNAADARYYGRETIFVASGSDLRDTFSAPGQTYS
ncbi:hypothetical protein AB0O34_32610 [Sphaerisporangium sp. NPDC088356]|uniref:hypothetical protein n=1 Tax=Sphaerisporangium sp. NPDC088356 TaxID=3154871 RepID=UPI0034123BF1